MAFFGRIWAVVPRPAAAAVVNQIATSVTEVDVFGKDYSVHGKDALGVWLAAGFASMTLTTKIDDSKEHIKEIGGPNTKLAAHRSVYFTVSGVESEDALDLIQRMLELMVDRISYKYGIPVQLQRVRHRLVTKESVDFETDEGKGVIAICRWVRSRIRDALPKGEQALVAAWEDVTEKCLARKAKENETNILFCQLFRDYFRPAYERLGSGGLFREYSGSRKILDNEETKGENANPLGDIRRPGWKVTLIISDYSFVWPHTIENLISTLENALLTGDPTSLFPTETPRGLLDMVAILSFAQFHYWWYDRARYVGTETTPSLQIKMGIIEGRGVLVDERPDPDQCYSLCYLELLPRFPLWSHTERRNV